MTAVQLQKLLGRIDLSQRSAARILGIHERTMRKYVAGDQVIPRVVELAMRCLAEHPEGSELAVRVVRESSLTRVSPDARAERAKKDRK